jgi:hypothetical protein
MTLIDSARDRYDGPESVTPNLEPNVIRHAIDMMVAESQRIHAGGSSARGRFLVQTSESFDKIKGLRLGLTDPHDVRGGEYTQ